jgi:ABC-type transport system involved in multi-copper enzyme maturation permease subunit
VKALFLWASAGLLFGFISGYVSCLISQSTLDYTWVAWLTFFGFPGFVANTSLNFFRHSASDNGQFPEGDTWGIVFWNGVVWMLILFAGSYLFGFFRRKRIFKIT